jgi:6-phosphogluconolactonase
MIQSYPTPEALADAVARHIVTCAGEAIAARGRFVIALSGGSTPGAAYRRLATLDTRPMRAGLSLDTRPMRAGLSLDTRPMRTGLSPDTRPMRAGLWRLTHVVWGDERCVPPDDPRSNYRMAKETLLDRVPIPGDQIHRIKGEVDPEQAAADYERELRALLLRHPERSEGSARQRAGDSHDPSLALRMTDGPLRATGIDLVLLGLGEDGHTASLFPGQPAVHETERWVLAVPSPAGDMWRVTLTPAVLNLARNVTFVVSGAGKSFRLAQVLEGPINPDLLPAQAIRPTQGRLTWMVDQAAAARLGPAGAPA